MLSVSKLSPGQEAYYERSVAAGIDDYYAGRGESPGVWVGRGAAELELDGVVRSVAGFRILNLLFSGRTLYIDDLVTHDSDRSRGFGAALFDWLVEHAKEQGCEHLTLDSGVQRFAAHRFYLKRGMYITSHHFQLKLNTASL